MTWRSVSQVFAHVRLQILRRCIRLQGRHTLRTQYPQSYAGPKLNASRPQGSAGILKMELANPLFPKPADLFHRIESGHRRLPRRNRPSH